MILAPLVTAALATVAFLYAAVGHAGASGYIAVLALAGEAPEQIKPIALLLNLAVAGVGCWNFLRAGHLPWQRLWPLYLLALPAAFVGGSLQLPVAGFRRLVGVVLLGSAWRLGTRLQDPANLRPPDPALLLLAGGSLGLLAGLTGTGGGVFLTPLLLLCRWCSTRQAAATSVLFILLNSMAGLAGWLWSRPGGLIGLVSPGVTGWLLVVVLAGGAGSRLGSRHWPATWIRRCLALVLLLAAFQLLDLGGLLQPPR